MCPIEYLRKGKMYIGVFSVSGWENVPSLKISDETQLSLIIAHKVKPVFYVEKESWTPFWKHHHVCLINNFSKLINC